MHPVDWEGELLPVPPSLFSVPSQSKLSLPPKYLNLTCFSLVLYVIFYLNFSVHLEFNLMSDASNWWTSFLIAVKVGSPKFRFPLIIQLTGPCGERPSPRILGTPLDWDHHFIIFPEKGAVLWGWGRSLGRQQIPLIPYPEPFLVIAPVWKDGGHYGIE
jgi:hypothetical protein